MKIYKYHSINIFLLHSLRKKEHWCSRFDLLNDPYELYFIDQTDNKVFKNLTQGVCVCCFSKTMSEILMWSHYADNHKGVCLEFEIDEELVKGFLLEMKYNNELTVLDKIELHNNGTLNLNIETNAKFLITKFKNWEYEQELRFNMINDDHEKIGKTNGYIGNLTSIYFGTRASQDDIDLIKHNTSHFENLEYFKVELDAVTMKIDKQTKI
jgi:hypothetical protein